MSFESLPQWVQDAPVYFGLSAMTFVMGVTWSRIVAPNYFRLYWRRLVFRWGGFCCLVALFFVAVTALQLQHTLFGWMK